MIGAFPYLKMCGNDGSAESQNGTEQDAHQVKLFCRLYAVSYCHILTRNVQKLVFFNL